MMINIPSNLGTVFDLYSQDMRLNKYNVQSYSEYYLFFNWLKFIFK